ncbi:MAG: SDR family oxidoreductase [Magnetococcales bacterium]|nr:SDR family oxidoreductase [Magnetococcales bacterium]
MSKYLLISGGTKGLGRAISNRFAREDYWVTALYHADERAAAALRSDRIDCVCCDIARAPFALPSLARDDELMIIHNAAYGFTPQPMHLSDWAHYRNHWEVAVGGAHHLIYPNLRQMLQLSRSTVIAVLSSVVAGMPPKGFAAYASAKLALKGFMESFAVEFSGRGIRCLCVSPGFMDTALTQGWDARFRQAAGADFAPSTEQVADEIFHLAHASTMDAAGENHLLGVRT